jgi:hypothetical protein
VVNVFFTGLAERGCSLFLESFNGRFLIAAGSRASATAAAAGALGLRLPLLSLRHHGFPANRNGNELQLECHTAGAHRASDTAQFKETNRFFNRHSVLVYAKVCDKYQMEHNMHIAYRCSKLHRDDTQTQTLLFVLEACSVQYLLLDWSLQARHLHLVDCSTPVSPSALCIVKILYNFHFSPFPSTSQFALIMLTDLYSSHCIMLRGQVWERFSWQLWRTATLGLQQHSLCVCDPSVIRSFRWCFKHLFYSR